MITTKTMSLSGLVALLASTASAQVYQTGGRAEDAFTWIQPEDTVILGQYGHSEAVYPSRMSEDSHARKHHANQTC
jgi:beta-glucosidase